MPQKKAIPADKPTTGAIPFDEAVRRMLAAPPAHKSTVKPKTKKKTSTKP
jgi:hypothetical protein